MPHTGDDTSGSSPLNSNRWLCRRWRRRHKALRWSPTWEPVPSTVLRPIPTDTHVSFFGEGNHQSTPPPTTTRWRTNNTLRISKPQFNALCLHSFLSDLTHALCRLHEAHHLLVYWHKGHLLTNCCFLALWLLSKSVMRSTHSVDTGFEMTATKLD